MPRPPGTRLSAFRCETACTPSSPPPRGVARPSCSSAPLIPRLFLTTELLECRSPSAAAPVDVVWHGGATAAWPSGLRPVDLKFDKCNRLLVTSDARCIQTANFSVGVGTSQTHTFFQYEFTLQGWVCVQAARRSARLAQVET